MKMTCDEARQIIPWLLDDEVDPVQGIELEAHLAGCEACRRILEHETRLRETVRRIGSACSAPPVLRRSIRELLEDERRHQGRLAQMWPAAAAAAVLLAFAWKGTSAMWAPDLDEVAQRHARDLPLDVKVAGVGQLPEVQRYFNSKLPFAVHVPRLSRMPVQLLGGRVMSLHDHQAAYLRYDVPRGRISVFVYEDPGIDISEVAPLYQVAKRRVLIKRVHGYTVARWRAAGLVYSMVTDLPESELPAVLDSSLPDGAASNGPEPVPGLLRVSEPPAARAGSLP